MNNHTASMEITVNVHESMLSRKLVFWTSDWKHVIKYDLYVKFPRIFEHNVQITAKFCCKNFNDVCQVFWILHHYTYGGRFFVDTQYRSHTVKFMIGLYKSVNELAIVCFRTFENSGRVIAYQIGIINASKNVSNYFLQRIKLRYIGT